jgi:hypothetical protein
MVVATRGSHEEHSWLPLFLPATAKRFRVADTSYRETLADAGAELVDAAPDVEIGALAGIGDDAPFVAVPLEAPPRDTRLRWARRTRRIVDNGALRVRAVTTVRGLCGGG